ELTAGFATRDAHEMDALASSIFAYKKKLPLIRKVDKVIARYHKEHLRDEVIKEILAVHNSQGVEKVLQNVEERMRPANTGTCPEKKGTKEQEPHSAPEHVSSEVLSEKLLLLKRQYESAIKDIRMLRENQQRLKRIITTFRNKNTKLHTLLKKVSSGSSLSHERPRHDNNTALSALERELGAKNRILKDSEQEIEHLNLFMGKIGKGVLAKKLPHLGLREFEKINKILQIREGDVVLVEDPFVYSKECVALLAARVSFILSLKKPSKTIAEVFGFPVLHYARGFIAESSHYALIPAEALEELKERQTLFRDIVRQYRKERQSE
ncbi:hypothetical protein COY95_00960, partial [Candidatus Woesearchaeota archaeon CG_4_10_14_0_8_um_filter_47_5]